MPVRTEPEATDPPDRRLLADIAKWGWHVVLVPEDEEGPGYAFTVGFGSGFGHPELAAVGLPLDVLHGMLNAAGEAVRSGAVLAPGRRYGGLLEGYDCAAVAVAPRWHEELLGMACWYYRGAAEFSALQLVWPDRQGRYPWYADAAPGFRAAQPVHGAAPEGGS